MTSTERAPRAILVAAGFMLAGLAFSGTHAAAAEPLSFNTKVYVRDIEKSVAFYSKIMDLKEAMRTTPKDLIEVILSVDGKIMPALILVGHKTPPAAESDPHPSDDPLLVFFVPDIKDTAARLKAAGYPVCGSTELKPVGDTGLRTAVVFTEDPDRNVLELIQREP